MFIRITSQALSRRVSVRKSIELASQRKFRRMFVRSRKRLIRYGLLTANLGLLVVVIFFVTNSPTSTRPIQQNAIVSSVGTDLVGPLDQVSSADIAVHIAREAGLPEANSVVNHADSVSAIESTAPADTTVVAKPQLVSAAVPSRKDIHTYSVVFGDTISSIATKFGVSSESIRGSNGLTGDRVGVGNVLILPPAGMNGIVYKVKVGDTPDTLARRFNASKEAIIRFNDAEVTGLVIGDQILIPDGVVASRVVTYNYYVFGGGGYDRGWCTDYASSRGGAPGGWGNANTWAFFAARTPGWAVSSTPRVGAIGQSGAGWAGHVGIVDAVSEDGTMIKYSDMNGLAGWGRVGYSDWVPTHSAFQKFIYRQ